MNKEEIENILKNNGVQENNIEDIVKFVESNIQIRDMLNLVITGVMIPGIISKESTGEKTYNPLSKEEYIQKIINKDIDGIGYNTQTMGRGVFEVGDNGEIVNYKGVDSRLSNENNIAIGAVDATPHPVIKNESYGLTVIEYPKKSGENGEIKQQLPEFRLKGASQLQNIVNELKTLRMFEGKNRGNDLIKLPEIKNVQAFSNDFCEKYSLPRQIPLTQDFLEVINSRAEDKENLSQSGNKLLSEIPGYAEYAKDCLSVMESENITTETRNETLEEFFSRFPKEVLEEYRKIPNFDLALQIQDIEYQLGQTYGQATRVLENPFRIMELEHYVKESQESGNTDKVQAVLDYTQNKTDGDYLEYYADTMGKNIAGFMNGNIITNNWEHRQDWCLSGEICDDSYDDITQILNSDVEDRNKWYNEGKFYNQVYLFASNMKIVEDAYKAVGKQVSENYQDIFLDSFIDNLKDNNILTKIAEQANFEDVIKKIHVKNADNIFDKEMFEYVEKFREKIVERSYEKNNVAEMHDQKSNKFFEDIESGKYNVPIASAVSKSEEECTADDLKSASRCVQLLISRENTNGKEANIEERE